MTGSRLVWTSDTEATRKWNAFMRQTEAEYQERKLVSRCRYIPIVCNGKPEDIDYLMWDPVTGEYYYN